MFTLLEDDIKKAKKVTRITTKSEGSYKKQKESSIDYQSRVGKGSTWFSKNQSINSSSEFEINLIIESPNLWEQIPKDTINGGGVPSANK